MSEQDKTTMSAEEVLQKFDKESDKRNLTGMWDKLISFICIAFAVFQLYTATFGVLDAHLQRAIHLAFGFSLIYLLYPGRKNWSRSVMHPLDVIFAVLSVASALYIVIFYDELVLRAGMNTEFDFSIAFIGTLLLFEAARRVVGWPMLTVALFFMFYAFAGPYMPGILAHRGVGVQEMFDHLFFTTEGILVLRLAYLQHLFISLSCLVPIWKLRVWASCLSTWLTLLPAGPQADLPRLPYYHLV